MELNFNSYSYDTSVKQEVSSVTLKTENNIYTIVEQEDGSLLILGQKSVNIHLRSDSSIELKKV